MGSKYDDGRIATGNNDLWMAKMCESDAMQFLSSIEKRGRVSYYRSHSKESLKTPSWDDSRDDHGGYPIPMVIQTKTINRKNDQRDEDTIFHRRPEFSNGANSRNGYIVKKDNSFEGKQMRKGKEERQCRQRFDPPSPSPSTKLILNDLTDLNEKIFGSLVEKGLEPEGSTSYLESSLTNFLRERQWERAKEYLKLHPEEASQKAKLPKMNSGDIMATSRDTYLTYPLHLACASRPLPPTELIKDLIHAYPEACHQFEEPSGALPIHLAANLKLLLQKRISDSPNHNNVVDLLISLNPESICAREKINGMTPLHIAASTTRAENGIVSPLESIVLDTLMKKSPIDALQLWKDNNGMTPFDWAWQNVYLKENIAKISCDESENESSSIQSSPSLMVDELCLHPFLRKDILNHFQPTIRLEPNKRDIGARRRMRRAISSTEAKKSPQKNSKSHISDTVKEPERLMDCALISSSELNNIREYANINMASRKQTCNKDALGRGKSATLHMQISVSELIHPSQHGKRRNSKRNGKTLPNPYVEVFAAHRCGISKSSYKSYPLHGSREGTWEDAFLALGLTQKQLRNGTNGASYIEVGIRVMHCPDTGSNTKLIGTCKVPLEALQKQQQQRLGLIKEYQKSNQSVKLSLPEPEKYPILKGFEVTGQLQVLSLSID